MSNRQTLELLNIINNNTQFKSIYEYIAHTIRNNIPDNLIVGVDTDVIYSWITKDVIKYLAMPAAYGKTRFANFKTINKMLVEENNLD